MNMGKGINGSGPEYGTVLSPDGKYLFFTRQTPPRIIRPADRPFNYEDYLRMHNSPDNGSSNIWWVNAIIIEELRSGKK
jgi:Tol biopolymer transport system component